MPMKRNIWRGLAVIVAAAALGGPSVQTLLLAQAAQGATDEIDGGWPRAVETATKARLLVYQPQIASWEGQRHMVAYAAVSYEAPGAARPVLGTLKVEAATSVAVEDRLVKFSPVKVAETTFPTLSREQVQDLLAAVEQGIPDDERVIALDRILTNLDHSQIVPRNVEGAKADPPTIHYSTRPAILVNFDSDPVWSPIKDNDLKFAVNTNWDVFQIEATRTFYLRHEKIWLKATSLNGPWSAAGPLPASFSKLPKDDNWSDVVASLPGGSVTSVPTVFVSTLPAELILVPGSPTYQAVSGTKLVWLSNTDSDIFRLGAKGPVYFLVSGRWFTAPDFSGPWTFASPALPEDFKRISLEHPRSRVLASVPGTPQAAEAVVLASVPQTARVNRKELKGPDVAYQGEPEFQPIEQTKVARAVNTDKDIIRVGDRYYMCYQGVWFVSRTANGPWDPSETVPAEIYQIPASSPSHHVTYVTVVEDDDDDEWITYAAVAGYTGMTIAWGCAVWGTGWYYPPYVWHGGFYPVYYPFYPTYGYGAWYNPWSGAYGRGAAWYGPYGGAGVAARYNPATGTYARGAAAWGPYGARGVAEGYNPRTGTYARTRQGSGVYGSWGTTSVQRGNQWAQTARTTNRMTGTTTRVTQGSGGGEAITRRGPDGSGGVARTGSGDVYAGRDGNVYRRQDDGSWQKYDGGSWGAGEKPTPRDRTTTSGANAGTTNRAGTNDTYGQLERDRAARTEGATRTRDYGTTRSNPTRSGYGGSYRAGGMRGGGGRRR
jgi:hypothetical protein